MQRFTLLVGMMGVFFFGLGCSDNEPVEISANQSQESAEDTGADTTTDVSDADLPDDTDVDEEEFEKPDEADPLGVDRDYRDPADYEDQDSESPGRTVGYWGREHMKPTMNFEESWLYEGEYFVRDGFYIFRGQDWLPAELRIYAIANGELLPIRLIEVHDEDGYPSIDEIESWEEEEFSYFETVAVEEWVPINYTLVIPPWAFPQKGAYNVHTMTGVIWEPDDDEDLRGHGAPAHQGHTIYYGSEIFAKDATDFDDWGDEAQEWEHHPDAGELVLRMLLGLAPPPEIHDWRGDDVPDGAELGGVIESSDPRIDLELYTAGGGYEGLHYNMEGPALYYVMQDDDVVDVFFYDAPEITNFLTENRGKAIPVEVELPLDGTPTAVWLLQAPTPFETYGATANYAQESNILFLAYDPDKG